MTLRTAVCILNAHSANPIALTPRCGLIVVVAIWDLYGRHLN
jgi:hypothetical protein